MEINKKDLEKLCESYNIDLDLAQEFIEKTKAFPFLMGEPSSYFIDYVKKENDIDITINRILHLTSDLKDKKINNIFILTYGHTTTIPTCHICKNKTYDYINIFENKSKKQVICLYCFARKYFPEIYGIEVDKSNILFNNCSIQRPFLFIYLIFATVIDFYFKNENKILNKNFIEKIIPDIINFDNNLLNKTILKIVEAIMKVYMYRETNISTKKTISIKELIDSLARNEKFINAEIAYVETSSTKFGNKYGAEISSWLIEQKTNKLQEAYIHEVIRETEKAFLCSYTIIGERYEETGWIPKSQVKLDNKNFLDIILKTTIKTISGEK